MSDVTIGVPRDEWLGVEQPDGYYRVRVADRLQQTRFMAMGMGMTWLSPYIPRYTKSAYGESQQWRNEAAGVVRATSLRALRYHFNDSGRTAERCGSCRVLSLVGQWKETNPEIRWPDVGDIGAWPIALRVDAQRVEDRLSVVANATWCTACDSAPWASTTQRCIWCEHQGGPPQSLAVPVKRAA